MTHTDFAFFERQLTLKTGMSLKCFSPGIRKRFFQRCLRPRLRELGFESYARYRRFLAAVPKRPAAKYNEEWDKFVDAIRVNYTTFFRERGTWEARLAEKARRSRRGVFRVLSAACSSGQEPYSAAMVLEKALAKRGAKPARRFEITAIDVNASMIALAKFGTYPAGKTKRQIPKEYHECLAPGFEPFPGRRSKYVQLKPELRKRVRFLQGNLLDGVSGTFDVIFCRNVLYYLDAETATRVLDALFAGAREGALLFTGRADRASELPSRWRRVGACVFEK